MKRRLDKVRLAASAAEFVRRGNEAEKAGEFSTAALAYGNAARLYKRAGVKHRARIWAARSKDVRKYRKGNLGTMGTLFRGDLGSMGRR